MNDLLVFFYHQNNDIPILFKYVWSKATAFQLLELKMIILIAYTIKLHTLELELYAFLFYSMLIKWIAINFQ